MRRFLILPAILAVGTLACGPAQASTRKPPPKPPAAIVITAASEKCWATGNTEVTVDVKANQAGTYDLLTRGDNDALYVVDTFTLAVGETWESVYPISWPSQRDNLITRTGTITPVLASKSVPAASVCSN
jgi:hypothetical protein